MAKAPPITKEEKKLFDLASKGLCQEFVDSLNRFLTRPRRASISNINVQNESERGRTLLHFAAKNGDRLMVQHLLNNGASGEICDKDNFLPLHVAVWGGHRDVARILLEKFPEVINARTADGSGILHYCLSGKNFEEEDVLFFINAGIDLSICNTAGESALLKAVKNNRTPQASLILKHCIEKLDRSVLMDLLKPTVMTCAKFGRLSILKECFDIGFDVNYVGGEGAALHMAVQSGRIETIQFLLLEGANPKLRNFAGESALDILNCGKLPLSEFIIKKMKNLVNFCGTKAGSMSGAVSVATTPIGGTHKLVSYFSVPAAPQSAPKHSARGQSGLCSDEKIKLDLKEQEYSDEYQELDCTAEEKKLPLVAASEDEHQTSANCSQNVDEDNAYMDMTEAASLIETLTVGQKELAAGTKNKDLIQFTNNDSNNSENGSDEKVNAKSDKPDNLCKYSSPISNDFGTEPIASPVKRRTKPTQKMDTQFDLYEDLPDVDGISLIVSTNDNLIGLKDYDSDQQYGAQTAAETEDTYNAIGPVYGNERTAYNVTQHLPSPVERQTKPNQRMDRWSEKLLDGNAISAVVSTNDNVIVLDEYGSEEGYRIQMAAEPDGTYNAIAPVYGNERVAARSFGNNSEPTPVPRQTKHQATRLSQMYGHLNDDISSYYPVLYSGDDNYNDEYGGRRPNNQRNALSVLNFACSENVKKYTDEYSDCEENEPELNEEQSQEKEEESVYSSLQLSLNETNSKRMSCMRASTRNSNSIDFSADNDKNVDWEFIDDILSSVGIHPRDSRFDPDLFALRVERTISEVKAPETIGDWLWVLQLRHLEPLFLANGYDNILFIGTDVLTKDSLKFMGVEDEATLDKILLSETVVRCMQVPKLDHIQCNRTKIADWLKVLHLGQYEENFTAAGCHDISHVTDAWQLALGINKYAINLLGHRRRLLASLDMKKLKGQLNTFLRQSQKAQRETLRQSVQADIYNERLAAVENSECRSTSTIISQWERISTNVEEDTINAECCDETATRDPVPLPRQREQNLEKTFPAQEPEEKRENCVIGASTEGKDVKSSRRSVMRKSIDSDQRSTVCNSITFGELNGTLQQLQEGNEITLVADASSSFSPCPAMESSQSQSTTLKSIDSDSCTEQESKGRNNLNVSQVIEEYKSKSDEPGRKRTFSKLSDLKTSSFYVGFLGVNSFDGIEPSEKTLLMACRHRLSKGVKAVPLVTIQISFSSLRLLDPKGNLSMEHAITNVQCAAMTSDHKTFAYVVIERKPVASSWKPLDRRADNNTSESARTTTSSKVEKITPLKVHRMCYIFQTLKDEEGQNVMAALRSSFEAAFAFVSSMDENNKK